MDKAIGILEDNRDYLENLNEDCQDALANFDSHAVMSFFDDAMRVLTNLSENKVLSDLDIDSVSVNEYIRQEYNEIYRRYNRERTFEQAAQAVYAAYATLDEMLIEL